MIAEGYSVRVRLRPTPVVTRVVYPGSIDRARLADCRDLRRLEILASLLVGGYEDAPLYKTVITHLDRRSHD